MASGTRTRPDAGEGKTTQNGNGNGSAIYLSVDELLTNAPKDIEEQDVEAFGGTVRIRALTAAQEAKVNQASTRLSQQGNVQVSIVEAEVMKFMLGVVQPPVDHTLAMQLHQQSGKSFKAVLQAIDELSGTDGGESAKAAAAFPGSEAS
jgi:hypothetical protein